MCFARVDIEEEENSEGWHAFLEKKQQMTTPLQDVKQLVDHLPESSSIEYIRYHLYVLEKYAMAELI